MCDNYKSINEDDVHVTDEGLVFNPFNPNNKEITLNDVQSILKKYGLSGEVYNIELYKRAFIHKSYTKRPILENDNQNITIVDKPANCLCLKQKSNERLEFLGDGILEAITKYYLYRRFPKENEGFMTEKKIALVKNESIGKLAYEMKLNNWLVISKHAEEKKTRTNLKKLGCLFEAFLGALFLDHNKIQVKDEKKWFENVFVTGPGFQAAQIFVEKIYEKHVNWIELIKNDDNYKNIFQVKIQKQFKTTPAYLEIDYDIDTGYHMGVYLCIGQAIHEVKLNDAIPFSEYGSFETIQKLYEKIGKMFVFMGEGTHKIKKKAEQLACEIALSNLDDN
tara:strand:- start:9076 stop:10083 length:1008 start_codon:yes stop_codon:yes gene_type:complete